MAAWPEDELRRISKAAYRSCRAMPRAEHCWLGSDGAAWLKQGTEVLPHALYRLDQYHLRRALVEGLGGDSQGYEQVAQAIAEGHWNNVQNGLRDAWKRAGKAQPKRIRALERCLENNWEGIVKLPEVWRLGVIEGQVFHHLVRRMKRYGARWSDRGADHLTRVLAVKGSGEWERLPGEKSECAGGARVPGHEKLGPEIGLREIGRRCKEQQRVVCG